MAGAADTAGMDDSFVFRTTVPIRRQLDPKVLKAAVLLGVLVLGIGSFARWVIASERASFVRADRRGASASVAVTQIGMSADLSTSAADAEQAVEAAFTAAKAAFTERRSFLDAGPAALAALQPGYTYVDGPSTMPSVVSIAATRHSWAASVLGLGGTCYWIRVTGGGVVSHGSGSACTGAAALAAAGRAG